MPTITDTPFAPFSQPNPPSPPLRELVLTARLKGILTIHNPGINLIPMPVLTFKVTDGEARIIRARAHSAKAKSLSAFLRKSVLQETPTRRKVVTKTHPVSGLPYDASPGPQVSDEEIRTALADFP